MERGQESCLKETLVSLSPRFGTHAQKFRRLGHAVGLLFLVAGGWLMMHNPTENLRLSITEWEQSLAFDTAAECETFVATRWVKQKRNIASLNLSVISVCRLMLFIRQENNPSQNPQHPPLSFPEPVLWIYRTAIGSRRLHATPS